MIRSPSHGAWVVDGVRYHCRPRDRPDHHLVGRGGMRAQPTRAQQLVALCTWHGIGGLAELGVLHGKTTRALLVGCPISWSGRSTAGRRAIRP